MNVYDVFLAGYWKFDEGSGTNGSNFQVLTIIGVKTYDLVKINNNEV
jgi:hypothetical protein